MIKGLIKGLWYLNDNMLSPLKKVAATLIVTMWKLSYDDILQKTIGEKIKK